MGIAVARDEGCQITLVVGTKSRYLQAAALAIGDPNYFPHAKIITFGIAHGSDKWDKPWRHISQPVVVVARLRNVNGFNYLDNALYRVDGYGTHIYPWQGPDNRRPRSEATSDVWPGAS